MSSYLTETMVGLSIIGSNDIQAVTFLVMGQYDSQLKHAIFHALNKKFATSEEDLNMPNVIDAVERIKRLKRFEIADILREAERLDKDEAKLYQERRMKELNSPSKHGTVSEICERYKLSKGEVRKMRAEGTLDTYILTIPTF
jgi:hypothetical protein